MATEKELERAFKDKAAVLYWLRLQVEIVRDELYSLSNEIDKAKEQSDED